MKLCIDCKHYGGVKASNGKYICNEPRNKFVHPVDGLEQKFDCFMLRSTEGLCGWDGEWWTRKEDK